jgi:hypothetical protein
MQPFCGGAASVYHAPKRRPIITATTPALQIQIHRTTETQRDTEEGEEREEERGEGRYPFASARMGEVFPTPNTVPRHDPLLLPFLFSLLCVPLCLCGSYPPQNKP